MKLSYCKEMRPYSETELKSKLGIQDEQGFKRIRDELVEKRILAQEVGAGLYSFEFVGVLIFSESVLFSMPKYVSSGDMKTAAKQLLVLFNEYSKRERLESEEVESLGSIDIAADYNMLSVITFLLYDYFENGLYSNEKNILLFKGEDEIDWRKTIEEIHPIINDGEPVYLEYYTSSTQNDEENYFRQLHKFILNECTNKLEELCLADLLGFEPLEFSIDEDSLGSKQVILSRINIELNTQFASRRQLLLKAMTLFINGQEKMESDGFSISFYGTRSFNLVWEKTCAYILDNEYPALKKYIARPRWKTMSGKTYKTKTLTPDIVSIYKQQTDKTLIITDAKYYDIILTDTDLDRHPGIGDVSKQYLYQLAFDDYVHLKNYNNVLNILLFPGEQDVIDNMGSVSIEFLKKLGLEDIRLIKIPAHKVFEMYIDSNKLDLEEYANFAAVS